MRMREWVETLAGEALVFDLVGKAFHAGPDRPWLDSLTSEDLFAESPIGGDQADVQAGLALLQRWSQANRGGISNGAFQALEAEYARLFVGPGAVVAPPWESVHFSEERLLFQRETFEVRAWYSRFGLEAPNLHAEPDDHIGLELSFVAHLATLGLRAIRAADTCRLHEALEGQRRFLAEHPLRWAPAWCVRVATASQSEFYQGLALLTRGALSEVAEQFGIEVPVGPEVAAALITSSLGAGAPRVGSVP
jgi:TorA maturation chaperone TorD